MVKRIHMMQAYGYMKQHYNPKVADKFLAYMKINHPRIFKKEYNEN